MHCANTVNVLISNSEASQPSYSVQVWALCSLPDFATRLTRWCSVINCSRYYRCTVILLLKLVRALL